MKVYFEPVKKGKFKTKIDKINKYIYADVKKINLDCESISLYWSHRKFLKIVGKKKYLPKMVGGKIFGVVNYSNKKRLEVYFNINMLSEGFTSDFYRFGFLHEIAHFVLQKQGQVFLEDIKLVRSLIKNFTQKNKELKNAVDFLNYIINDMNVDMNFIEQYPWSAPTFYRASEYMLRRYTNLNAYKQYTENKISCLFYLMSATRFFIPVSFMMPSKRHAYKKLLSYFKEKDKSQILKFNNQLTELIYCLYKKKNIKEMLNVYSKLLITLKKMYIKCF